MTTLAISYLLLKKYFKKDFRSQTWRRFPFDILGKVSTKVLIDETSRAHLLYREHKAEAAISNSDFHPAVVRGVSQVF